MGITADTSDLVNMQKIPSEKEELYKITFDSHKTREKYYAVRRSLKNQPNVWFRDDLIRKREILAKQLRIMAKGGQIKKCWTDRGTVLIIRNGEERPVRINNIDEV